jgi:hydrogenase nickel incorporation protein HypA/HybF
MHELSLVTEIYRTCRSRMDGNSRIESVRLAIGELSAVEPDLLQFAWEAVTEGGPDAGATLDVEWRPARQLCDACGQAAERSAGSWLRSCPRCGKPLRIEGGQELDILQFSFVRADEPGAL